MEDQTFVCLCVREWGEEKGVKAIIILLHLPRPGGGGGCYPMIGLSLTAIPYQSTTSFLFLKIDNSNILPKDTFDPSSLVAQTCCLVCNMVTIIT